MEGNFTEPPAPPQYEVDINCMEAVDLMIYAVQGHGFGINWTDACWPLGDTRGNQSFWQPVLDAIYFQVYPPPPEIYFRVTRILSDHLLFVVCLFGLLANLLILVVLVRDKKKNATVYFLLALAVIDEFVLLSKIILPGRFVAGDTEPNKTVDVAVLYLTYTAETMEVWMIVAMTIERFIVVCFPLKSRSLCTVRNARIMIAVVVIGSIVYRIPLYAMYADLIEDDKLFNIIYEVGANGIFIFLLPMGVLFVLNAKLMMSVYEAKRKRQEMTQTQATGSRQAKKNSSAMTCNITAVVLLFLVCQTLRFVSFLWFVDASYWNLYVFGEGSMYPMRFVVQPFADLMLALNSALNFFIYFFFFPKFRIQFRETFFPCIKSQNSVKHSITSG